MSRCLNLKLEEKQQECEDNIAYYTQREAEFEAKIDELMTRLQEQTAAYMKLQVEFDNYEWWEEGGEEEEKRRGSSRESLQAKSSRPSSRPPTRQDHHKFTEVVETLEAEEEEEEEEEEENSQQVMVVLNGDSDVTAPAAVANGLKGEDTAAPSTGYSWLAASQREEEAVFEPQVPARRADKVEEQQRNSWLEEGQST